jgi:hypothetical protein
MAAKVSAPARRVPVSGVSLEAGQADLAREISFMPELLLEERMTSFYPAR